MMRPEEQYPDGPAADQPEAGAFEDGLAQAERMGNEVVRNMQALRELLVSRARSIEAQALEVQTARDRLQVERDRLGDQQREQVERLDRRERALVDREAHLAEQAAHLERKAADAQALEQELEGRRHDLQHWLDAVEAERGELERRAAALDGGERRLQADRRELAVAAEALAARQAALAEADQAARARHDALEAEWRSRLGEVAVARESVAILQSQLEAELARATYQDPGLHGERGPIEDDEPQGDGLLPEGTPASGSAGTRDLVERMHRMSRDARRRVTGG